MEAETWTNSINQTNKMALLAWAKETCTDLVQINGQRRYGGPPPGWVGDPPPAGTEVFIGKLPQDMYENVLIPLFQSVGRLYEFRLMMTFSGLNRGFAYAKYSSRRGAKEAIAAFNNFEVREGCAIVVCKSTEKCELSVDGLAASVSQRELEALLRQVTAGLHSVTLCASPCQKRAQLAVLKYSSHQAAAMAKKTLMEAVPKGRLPLKSPEPTLVAKGDGEATAVQLHERELESQQRGDEGGLAEPRSEAETAVVQGEGIVQPGARGQEPGGPQAGAPVSSAVQCAGPPERPVPEAVPGDTPVPHQVRSGKPQRVAAVLVPRGDPRVPRALQWVHVGPAGRARQERARGGEGCSGAAGSPDARMPAVGNRSARTMS